MLILIKAITHSHSKAIEDSMKPMIINQKQWNQKLPDFGGNFLLSYGQP
jgi:hypothetical protein